MLCWQMLLKKNFLTSCLVTQQRVSNMSMHEALMKKSMHHKNTQFAATAPSDRLLSPGE